MQLSGKSLPLMFLMQLFLATRKSDRAGILAPAEDRTALLEGSCRLMWLSRLRWGSLRGQEWLFSRP